MATALEHMQADFAQALAVGGVAAVIDGGDVRVFSSPAEISPSEFERNVIIRRVITHQLGDVSKKVPGQVVSLNGDRLEVVSHTLGLISGTLILQRHSG